MSGTEEKSLQDRLLQRLKEIPAGSIAAVARKADLPVRHLNRLRAGENLDIRLSTLAKLAYGLGVDATELIAGGPGAPLPPLPVAKANRRTVKAVQAARKHVKALVAALEELAEGEKEDR